MSASSKSDATGLAEYLKSSGAVKSRSLLEAFRVIDRKDFVPVRYKESAYWDEALPIGHGQTISQPYTVALMLEFLDLKPGQKVLDIGSGSGWTTALLSHMVGTSGQVVGVELIPELVKAGQDNLAKYRFHNSMIIPAKPGHFGVPDEAPFDRILVSAEYDIVPEELVMQLSVSGNLVIPVKGPIIKIHKGSAGRLSEERIKNYTFAFVPLVRR